MNNKKEITEANLLIANEVERAMNALVDYGRKMANVYNGDSIPISMLEDGKNIFMTSYRNGMIGSDSKPSLIDRLKNRWKR